MRDTQSTTIPDCKIKMKALFPSKKEKEKKYNRGTKRVIHTHTRERIEEKIRTPVTPRLLLYSKGGLKTSQLS